MRERESEERLKASDEGAGMTMSEMRRSKEEGKYQRRYDEDGHVSAGWEPFIVQTLCSDESG